MFRFNCYLSIHDCTVVMSFWRLSAADVICLNNFASSAYKNITNYITYVWQIINKNNESENISLRYATKNCYLTEQKVLLTLTRNFRLLKKDLIHSMNS